jgi:hypothetical protein
LGNSEDEAGRVGDVASDALYNLISSVPTTALGLGALVSYLAEEVVDVAHPLQGEQGRHPRTKPAPSLSRA